MECRETGKLCKNFSIKFLFKKENARTQKSHIRCCWIFLFLKEFFVLINTRSIATKRSQKIEGYLLNIMFHDVLSNSILS